MDAGRRCSLPPIIHPLTLALEPSSESKFWEESCDRQSLLADAASSAFLLILNTLMIFSSLSARHRFPSAPAITAVLLGFIACELAQLLLLAASRSAYRRHRVRIHLAHRCTRTIIYAWAFGACRSCNALITSMASTTATPISFLLRVAMTNLMVAVVHPTPLRHEALLSAARLLAFAGFEARSVGCIAARLEAGAGTLQRACETGAWLLALQRPGAPQLCSPGSSGRVAGAFLLIAVGIAPVLVAKWVLERRRKLHWLEGAGAVPQQAKAPFWAQLHMPPALLAATAGYLGLMAAGAVALLAALPGHGQPCPAGGE
jgi:hypothetical protein